MTANEGSPLSHPAALGRLLPFTALLLAAAVFFLSGAHRYLTLEALREHYMTLTAFVEDRYPLAIILFAAAYIAVTALSVPGATVMSLLGGFLFGSLTGTLIVVVAATIGAVIVFMAAKTAFGDVLQRRAGKNLLKMEEGFRENAFSYLLLMRLIPLFPFFLVNVAPAFFGVKLRTFAAATAIGIIPGAFAFVSAGNGLGDILAAGAEISFSGLLLRPAVATPILALGALALLPIVLKALGFIPERKSRDHG